MTKKKFYVEMIRVWEPHSYDAIKKCMTCSHPLYQVKRRRLFGKDIVIKSFYGNSDTDAKAALDFLETLNSVSDKI